MTIQIDTREKSDVIAHIVRGFERNKVQFFRSKLYVGDYMSLDRPRLVIDRKYSLLELCSNVCQGHKRFAEELKRAKELGIKLVVLCEHGEGIKSIDDVLHWENPRLDESPLAMSGARLYRVLQTLSIKYKTEFLFCDKKDTARRIIDILQ